jgi:Ice-binding-like
MSNRFDLRRARLAGIALAATLAFAAVPVAAQASAVNLATASPFVVLGGSTDTNEGSSVLNGDLGLSPGTSLTGFNEAVVNGATHENDAVAAQAQSDLTTAYNVAAGQPISPGNDLTGINLGNQKLTAGAYGFSSSAQLTGQLTLDAQGNPNAQFVFVIGTTLTTASASSVVLVNGASPCNVYWKVGSSATLGSTTAFEGNLMSLASISVNNGATVVGRLLAREGAVTLINDVLSAPNCATGSTPTPTPSPTAPGTTPTATGPTATTPKPAKGGGSEKAEGKGKPGSKPATGNGTATIGRGRTTAAGTRATVHGREIKGVVFTDNGKRVPNTSKTQTNVPSTPGTHVVVAHVTFKDTTKAQTKRFTFRVVVPVLHPRHGPSQFTG